MSRVRRIYAEKRPGYDVAARQLCQELREALGTDAIARVRLFQRYDVEGLSDAAFESARGIIFSEPNADVLYDGKPASDGRTSARSGISARPV